MRRVICQALTERQRDILLKIGADRVILPEPGAIVKLTQRVLIVVLAIEAAGAALLWLNWRGGSLVDGDFRSTPKENVRWIYSRLAYCSAAWRS